MDIIHFFDHHGKKIDKAHFIHLIHVAKADGTVEEAELQFLHRIGRRFGFTDAEIDKLIASDDKEIYTAPYELQKKFDQMYDIAIMILADGVVTESEKLMAKRFAVSAGFQDDEIDNLINLLIEGIREDKDEDDLFALYKKRKR